MVAADLNGDGKPDIAFSNTAGDVGILLNHGDGTFAAEVDVGAGPAPGSIVAADLNGDGKLDLVFGIGCAYCDNQLTVLINEGSGTFAPPVHYPTGISPDAIVAADFNGDGKPDIALTDIEDGDGRVTVLLNQGDGTFGGRLRCGRGAGATGRCNSWAEVSMP
jgi:FG-GAP-like repeat